MISFGPEVCGDFAVASTREWLETNGIGGFASATMLGLNTRRYHGLLVAAVHPPVGRQVLVSRLEERLVHGAQSYALGVNQYPDMVHPQGYLYLKGFRLDPFPVFTYEVEDIEIEKSVFMVHGENTTVVEYRVTRQRGASAAPVVLEIAPLLAARDYHSMAHENAFINGDFEVTPGLLAFHPYQTIGPVYVAHSVADVTKTGVWYRNFAYAKERERGFDEREDLFNPCVLTFALDQDETVISVLLSTAPRSVADAADLRAHELARRKAIISVAGARTQYLEQLVAAADQFIVKREDEKTVIAGYHWFSDWGRDTMIALPGLTLATGRAQIAKSILLEFSRHIDRGMLPNRFPDEGQTPEYNTVDATLWYFEALRAWLEVTGDFGFVRANLYHVLADIIYWHRRGTRYQIYVDADGLLHSGEPGVQLTWMDAKVGDWVVTPRQGKAVEIQALWYNALRVMESLAREFKRSADEHLYGAMAEMAYESFNEQFWNGSGPCLFDVVDQTQKDASIRPNQIIAVSLCHSMLDQKRAAAVVAEVERELLTPVGLRSLAASDANYKPSYEGNQLSRDSAYHQGTVWAWLMGPFISAYLRVHGARGQAQAAQWVEGFCAHANDAGLGQVSEIFDAEPPHQARGCIAQAWSVAELLRVGVECSRGNLPMSLVNRA